MFKKYKIECCRTSMLVSGLSADHHDEYFSIIMMLISSQYTANYGRDPIWPDHSIIEHFPLELSNICRFTNLMVCVRIFLLAWVGTKKKD